MTGSQDGHVKLWSKHKQLLAEFEFFEASLAGVFRGGSVFGVLLGHKEKISEISRQSLESEARRALEETKAKGNVKLFGYVPRNEAKVVTEIKFINKDGQCIRSESLPLLLTEAIFSPR